MASAPRRVLVRLVQSILEVLDALKAGAHLVLQDAQVGNSRPRHLVPRLPHDYLHHPATVNCIMFVCASWLLL